MTAARVGALLDCMEHMLVSPFPSPVPVPIGSVLSLLHRVLAFDAASGEDPTSPPLRPRCLRLPSSLPSSAREHLSSDLRFSNGLGGWCPA